MLHICAQDQGGDSMLVRDNLGYIHEIPDTQFAQAPQVVFDGLGNPVGQLGDYWDIVKSVGGAIASPLSAVAGALPAVAGALPAIAGAIPGLAPILGAGNMIGNLFRGGAAAPGIPAPPGMVSPAPPFAPPAPFPYPNPAMPLPFPGGLVPSPGWPIGWHRPQFPSPAPQRMYMRCAVCPAPGGLVPPVPPRAQPGAPQPYQGFPAGRARTHHHRRRR